MTTEKDAYIEIRWRILSGALPMGATILIGEWMDEFSLAERRLRSVLSALVADGYIERDRPRRFQHSVSSISPEQLDEWPQMLCAFIDIALGRMAMPGGDRSIASPSAADAAQGRSTIDEQCFLGTLGFLSELLGGQRSQLCRLATQFLPPVFFRLAWLASWDGGREPDLAPVIAALRKSIDDRDMEHARSICRGYCESLAPPLRAQLEDRRKGPVAYLEPLKSLNRMMEPRLTGHDTIFGVNMEPTGLLPALGVEAVNDLDLLARPAGRSSTP